MINYRGPGRAINVVCPTGGMSSGVGYIFGSMFGISPVDATVGESVALWVGAELYTLPKTAATASNDFAVGEAVYWDDTNKVACKSASGMVKIGVCSAKAASLATSVEVRLNGTF